MTMLYELVRVDGAAEAADDLEALAAVTQGEMFPTMAQQREPSSTTTTSPWSSRGALRRRRHEPVRQ